MTRHQDAVRQRVVPWEQGRQRWHESGWRAVAGLAATVCCSLAMAQTESPAEALHREIASLRQQQEIEITAIRERTDRRIAEIEAGIERLDLSEQLDLSDTPSSIAAVPTQPPPSALQLSGDFRLRYEGNDAAGSSPSRHRGVLRARLGGVYAITDSLSVGARLATGDPDDPNSTDMTLSDFADDLAVGLDQAYLRFHLSGFEIAGGKIPNPFVHTELVWDNDVNPDGLGFSWSAPVAAATVRVAGLYFLIDEQSAGPDSSMSGVQAGIDGLRWRQLAFDFAAAYYDYTLASLAGADAGDIRSNLLAPDGTHYLSDFDLVDFVGGVTYGGGTKWPLRLAADYVLNQGAATADDSGYQIDIQWGRATQKGDTRFAYGYARAGKDAVLTASSHDNTALASGYLQHSLAMDYVLGKRITLNGTWYHYRADDAPGPTVWMDRVRLNFLTQF